MTGVDKSGVGRVSKLGCRRDALPISDDDSIDEIIEGRRTRFVPEGRDLCTAA